MSDKPRIYGRKDCLHWHQVAKLIVQDFCPTDQRSLRNARRAMHYARQYRGLPHVVFSRRCIMYPTVLVNDWLGAKQRNCG